MPPVGGRATTGTPSLILAPIATFLICAVAAHTSGPALISAAVIAQVTAIALAGLRRISGSPGGSP